MVIFDHVDEYVIRDVGEMLSDVRYEGVKMAQRVMSVLLWRYCYPRLLP